MTITRAQRLARIQQEVLLAAAQFSHTKRGQFDHEDGAWAMLYDVPLPAGYNRTSTDVLIELPKDYPITPPDFFYLDRGLRRTDGRPLSHLFDHPFGTRLPTQDALGWAAGCLHVRSWRPAQSPLQGHSLLSMFRLTTDTLQRWLTQ